MSTIYTSNGLELIDRGAFVGDFGADTMRELAVKTNTNVILIDEIITTVDILKTKVDILEARGHVAGIVNGGTFTA